MHRKTETKGYLLTPPLLLHSPRESRLVLNDTANVNPLFA